MPWNIRETDGQFCVFKEGESEPLHCYASEAEAKDYLAALYANEKKAAPDDFLIGFGEAVKALPDGKIGGHVVRFTHAEDYDVTGEFFTAETDFGLEMPAKVGLYYHHGFDPTIGKRRLGHAEVKAQDDGLWFEAQLDLADRYQARIYQLARAGKLGASSGAVKHLVDREVEGKAARLTSWPLGEVSLTPSPAMPVCGVQALKAWLDEAPSFDDLVSELPGDEPGLKAALPVPGTLAAHSEAVVSANSGYLARLEERLEARVKAGRMLSGANVRELEEVLSSLDGLGSVKDRLAALLEKARPPAEAGAAAPPLDGRQLEGEFLATLARLNGVSVDASTAGGAALPAAAGV